MVTDGSTTDGTTGQIVARHDFLPFGVEIPRSWSVTDGLSPKFTGQDHDSETSLEFYQARYLAAGLGRFMSTDPGNAGADLTDPQTWNLYSYVRNNPLKYIDPSGLCTQDADGNLSDDDGVPCTDNSGNVNLPGNSVTVTDTAPQVPFDSSGFGDQSFLGALFYSDSCGYACPGGSQTQQQTAGIAVSKLQLSAKRGLEEAGKHRAFMYCDHYGLTGVAAGIGALGIPIPKALVLGRTAALSGASSTMSL